MVDCSAILADRLKDPRVPDDEAARRALDLFSLLEVLWVRLRFLPRPLPFGIYRKIKPKRLLSEIFKTVNGRCLKHDAMREEKKKSRKGKDTLDNSGVLHQLQVHPHVHEILGKKTSRALKIKKMWSSRHEPGCS